MNWFSKVVWSEGMFLRPQHFQQHERYIDHVIQGRCGGLRSYDYGFKSLQLDKELLGLGKVAIIAAEGLLPDGTPFRIPDDMPAPAPLEGGQEGGGFGVVLALPAQRVGAGDVRLDDQTEGATRFTVERAAVCDSTLRDSIEADIDIASLRFRLMRDRDDLGGYITMGLMRIAEVRTDGSLVQDDAYLPPVLNCQAIPELKGYIVDLHGRLRQRGEDLASTLGELGRSSAAELWEFMLLQIINRYEPLLQHLAKLPVLHPEALYQLFVQLAGELAMLTRESKRPADLPDYRHDALHETFAPLILELHRAFSRDVEPNAIWIDLEDRGNYLHRGQPLDRDLLVNASLVLAVKADMAPGDIISRVKEIKMISEEKINTIGGLSGVELQTLTVKPKEIPHHAGFMYFQLDRGGNPLQREIWSQLQQAGSIWIYDSGRFPGLQMEFWAIKP